MDEVSMLISGVVEREGKKLVRVSFLRGKSFADGLLPDGVIEKWEGFTQEEVEKLENYMRANRQDILRQAKEVKPLRNWLMS